MNNFYEKDLYDYEDIISLIENEVEESIHLEFKSANALGKTDGKKKEISKDIAAFANSDGGIIIYGILEESHKAKETSFIDGNIFTKEWIEHVVNATIQKRVNTIKIFPIREKGIMSKTIYLIKIPKSLNAPHISKDKRFYKRFNFESVPMEEHEVRESYGRKLKTKLILDRSTIRQIDKEDEDNYRYVFEVGVYNDGDIPEQNYKVNVLFTNFKDAMKITWDRVKTNYDYTLLDNLMIKISSHSQTPIFPGEFVNSIRFTLELPKKTLIDINELEMTIDLFYSNGEERMDASELMHKFKGKYLEHCKETFKF